MPTRQRVILMFALTGAMLGAGALANYLLNPYGAWRATLIDPIFRHVEQERIVTPYLLRSAHPETLLLGSSRVLRGMRIDQGERDGVMNGALNGATIRQLSQVVSLALENPRLKRIVWGVDFFSFEQKWDRDRPDFDARMAGSLSARFEDTLLSFDALASGLDELHRAMRGAAKLQPTQTSALPWPMPLVCSDLESNRRRGLARTPQDEIVAQAVNVLRYYDGYRFSPEFFDTFRATIEAARRHGVETIVFVPPMSGYELELIRQTGNWAAFQEWKRRLAELGPFWDFSGYNEIGLSDTGFIDVIHFKPAIGQVILRKLLADPIEPCSGLAQIVAADALRVDGAGIEAMLARQDAMRRAATVDASRFSQLAAQAIALRSHQTTDAADDSAANDDANGQAPAMLTRRR
ncbi:MAG TPA: hypothetical protein VEU51_15775 [Candidatus Acidoferrales bacterium]|nr:hypothetical protein [Candidatus Acidoferrales bacterium]